MHMVGLAIAAVAVIYFLNVSPGFRKAVGFTIVGLVVLGGWWIYHAEEPGRQQQQQQLQYQQQRQQQAQQPQQEQQQLDPSQRFAATAIKPRDLALKDVAFAKPSYCLGKESSSVCISDWILKGLVTNNSNYDLAWMTFEIKAVDCPAQSTEAVTHAPSRKCRIVGQVRREAPASVAAGQTGEFSSYAIKFEGIPPKDQRFERTFSWTLIKASLAFQAP